MDGVRKVDQFTVAFHLKRTVVDFPAYLNTYQAVILPANWPGTFAKHPWGDRRVQAERVRARGSARPTSRIPTTGSKASPIWTACRRSSSPRTMP